MNKYIFKRFMTKGIYTKAHSIYKYRKSKVENKTQTQKTKLK